MNEETCATPALLGEVARQWRATARPRLSADNLLARGKVTPFPRATL